MTSGWSGACGLTTDSWMKEYSVLDISASIEVGTGSVCGVTMSRGRHCQSLTSHFRGILGSWEVPDGSGVLRGRLNPSDQEACKLHSLLANLNFSHGVFQCLESFRTGKELCKHGEQVITTEFYYIKCK